MINYCDDAIPFADRHCMTKSGYAFIWPFLNVPKGGDRYELLLDNNAATRAMWVKQLPRELKNAELAVNLWPALSEQWLSNEAFRNDPERQTNDKFITPLTRAGFTFDKDFVRRQIAMLRASEAAISSQVSLLFPYIAIIKALTRDADSETALARLRDIGQRDIPRFTGCLMLAALALGLKGQGCVSLRNSAGAASPLLESFFAHQPGRKSEAADHMDLAYLRNRSGDLSLWYTPSLLVQLNYDFLGTPVIVTQDKMLHQLVLRALPPAIANRGQVSFAMDPQALPVDLFETIRSAVSNNARPGGSTSEKGKRLHSLYTLAASLCPDHREKAALKTVWDLWCKPDYPIEFAV